MGDYVGSETTGVYHIFHVGRICAKSECECSAYDGRLFDIVSEPEFNPPLHPNCDCYTERLETIREAFLSEKDLRNARAAYRIYKRDAEGL